MKRCLFILLVALPGFIFAQVTATQIGNFYTENAAVVYHHVFVGNASDSAPILAKKLMNTIALLPKTRNLVQSGNIITGNFDWVSTTTFESSELKADFTIEVRKGRYRVTILNFIQNKSNNAYIPWENTYIKSDKKEWRSAAGDDLPSYDTKFTNMFTLPLSPIEPAW